jgi:AraC-like DNA-binding protein
MDHSLALRIRPCQCINGQSLVILRQMPESSPMLVPSSYLAVFVDHLIDDDDERTSLLAGAGIDKQSLRGGPAMLPLARVLGALREIDREFAPGWHIEPSLSLEAAHHGPLGVAIVTAATLGQAVDTLVRFESIRAPWTLMGKLQQFGRLTLDVLPTTTLEAPGELLMEINLIVLADLLAQLLDSTDDLQVIFPARDRAHQPLLRAKLPGRCRFEGSHHALSLPADRLEQPCLLADPELHASARRRCEAVLGRSPSDGRLAARIRQDLMSVGGRAPRIETMAERHNQSSRSLTRRLADHRTSYRRLVQEVRYSIARDLLLHSDQPVAAIANRLGYSDPANFGRAFRRWCGVSPGQVRRDAVPADPAKTS